MTITITPNMFYVATLVVTHILAFLLGIWFTSERWK